MYNVFRIREKRTFKSPLKRAENISSERYCIRTIYHQKRIERLEPYQVRKIYRFITVNTLHSLTSFIL